MKNDEILHKWINNTISQEELSEFKLRPEYDSLVDLYKKTEHLAIPALDKDKVLSNILAEPKKETPEKSAKIIGLSNYIKAAAAAVAILVAALVFWPNPKMINYTIGTNQKMEGTFPDGSTFILNAVSDLSYDQKQWDSKRIINLDGEAFFDVEKGSSFVVQTKNGTVEVLGTEFNVKSRKNMLEVSCQEGMVMVNASKSNTKKKLTAAEAVRFSGTSPAMVWSDPNNNGKSWTSGITKLKDVSLMDVITELKLHYDVKINSSSIDVKERLSCSIPHDDLDLALSACFTPLKIKYQKIGNQIKLTK